MDRTSSRRDFLKKSATLAAGFTAIRSGILSAQRAPNDRLNIAIIGCGNRGKANANQLTEENIVALCDIDENELAEAKKQFPDAQTYVDWRECLEQGDIDAVMCSTTDHTHAFVNIWALNRGMHVYSEKPLANSVHEARMVREKFLANDGKVATQMGVQRHTIPNMRRTVELVRRGAIGEPKAIHMWCSRTPEGGDYLPAEGEPPGNIHWDLWIGPSPDHPFNPQYVDGNCLAWNRFWDFGSGQIGDMGSHVVDIGWWALGLESPITCEAEGPEPKSDATCPIWMTAAWDHPATENHPALKVHWYDGGKKPELPTKLLNIDEMFLGAFIEGTQGNLFADFDNRILMPIQGDMTHYDSPTADDLIQLPFNHQREWVHACKTGEPTSTDFDYSGRVVEHNLLALVAYRVGQKLEYDPETGTCPNCPEAQQYIEKTYREGWALDG